MKRGATCLVSLPSTDTCLDRQEHGLDLYLESILSVYCLHYI